MRRYLFIYLFIFNRIGECVGQVVVDNYNYFYDIEKPQVNRMNSIDLKCYEIKNKSMCVS